MRGGRDYIGIGNGAFVQSGDDQARNMGDVADVERADTFGDVAEGLEIDVAGIGRGAGNNDLRFVLLGEFFDFVVIEQTCFRVDDV